MKNKLKYCCVVHDKDGNVLSVSSMEKRKDREVISRPVLENYQSLIEMEIPVEHTHLSLRELLDDFEIYIDTNRGIAKLRNRIACK